jgi:hypothetical protein
MNAAQLREHLRHVPDSSDIVTSDGMYWHLIDSVEVWQQNLILRTGRVHALVLNSETVSLISKTPRTPGVV